MKQTSLRKEVNLFDEDFGLNLKKLDNIKFKKLYKRRVIIIYKIITLYTIFIARIPKSKIFKKGKSYELKRKLTEEYLKSNSPIFEDRASSVRDIEFKKQFASLLMTYVIDELESIVKGQLKESDRLTVDESKVMYLTDIYSNSLDYISESIIIFGNYQPYLLNLYEKLSIRKISNDKVSERNKHIKLIHYIRENIESVLGYRGDINIAMNEIIRLSYSIATNQIKYPKDLVIPLDNRNSSDIKKVLRRLGKEIVKEWNKNGRPLFVHIFFKCAPLNYTKYPDINDDLYLNCGVKIIQLTDYMINDKKIHRIIQKMIL